MNKKDLGKEMNTGNSIINMNDQKSLKTVFYLVLNVIKSEVIGRVNFLPQTLVFLAFVIIFLIILPVNAQENVQEVKVGVYQDEPLVFEENGVVKGFYIDILREIAKSEGWELKYVQDSFPSLLEKLKRGEVDLVVAIAYSEERDKIYDFNKETVISNWGQIFSANNEKIDSIFDLNGKRIAVVPGDIYYLEFKKIAEKFGINCDYLEVDGDYMDVMENVEMGLADAGIVSRFYGHAKANNFNVRETAIIFAPIELKFAAPEGKNSEILSAIDRNLVVMKEDKNSVYYRAMGKWFGFRTSPPLPTWFGWAVLLFTILVFFAAYRSYYLSRKLKKREKEVIQSEEKYKGLFENSLDAIAITNLDGEFVEVNRAFERMTGYSRDEIIGMSYMDLVPREYSKLIFESYNKAFRAEENIYGLEFELLTKNGRRKYVEGNISLIKQGGNVVAFQGNFRDITEKKKIENALRESEEMFRSLAEKSLVGIYLIQDGVFKYVNPKLAEDFGYDVNEMVGKEVLHFIFDEDKEMVGKNIKERIERDLEFIRYKPRVVRSDGDIRTFEIYGSKISYKGRPAVIGTAIDVTEEEAYKKKLEEYKRFYRNAHDLFFILDSKARFIDVNPKYAEMLGYRKEELIGHTARRFFDPKEVDMAREMFKKVMRGETVRYEAKAIPKDMKEEYIVEIILWPVFENGMVVGAEGIVRDITEKKKIENALRESEEMFRSLAEKSLVGIYLIQDGVFKYVNPKMAELWGYSVDELIGKSPLEFIHPEDREIVRRNLEKRVKGEIESINYRLRMVRKDGKVRHNEVFGSRVIYRGKPAVIGSLIDVTERLELEKAKLKAFEQIEKNIENYAILVDQIRNPLAIISGITEMKLDGKNGELRELREIIMEAVKRIEDVVSKLDMGWLESETIRDFLRGELVGEVGDIESWRWDGGYEKKEE